MLYGEWSAQKWRFYRFIVPGMLYNGFTFIHTLMCEALPDAYDT